MCCIDCPCLRRNGYCVKVGGNVSDYQCEEEKPMIKTPRANQRKLNRYDRKMKYKRKLKRMADNCSMRYPSGAYYITDESWFKTETYLPYWQWTKENAIYVKRYYRANHTPGRSGYLKRLASRKFRRYKDEILQMAVHIKKHLIIGGS